MCPWIGEKGLVHLWGMDMLEYGEAGVKNKADA